MHLKNCGATIPCNIYTKLARTARRMFHRMIEAERLEELLEEVLAENDRVLIFTEFAEMGTPLGINLGYGYKFRPALVDTTA